MVTEPNRAGIPGWLGRLYPFSPRSFLTPQGATMSYLDEGPRGEEAVLMLHGNPTWSFYYRELVRELSGGIRCVAPDHVGMGLSDKPQHYDYRLSSRIADIEALVDSLGLRRIHLVVHDWGGAIGFGLGVRRPARIGKIVILNTAAFPSSRIPLRIALCRFPLVGEVIVRGLNGFAEPATWMAMAARRLTWEERRGYLLPYGSWASRVGVHRFIRDIPLERDHPSRPTLERIAAGLKGFSGHETLIVWGGRDFCFDDTFLSRWRELYPHARVERLGKAGHYVLEDAGPEARLPISNFLKKP
jgi:pimeloyl-ACP methyl ester carboxylesterase